MKSENRDRLIEQLYCALLAAGELPAAVQPGKVAQLVESHLDVVARVKLALNPPSKNEMAGLT